MKRHLLILTALILLSVARISFADPNTNESNQWQYKLSAEERFRYEFKNNLDLNDALKDKGSQFYQRVRIGGTISLMDEHQKPKAELFVEGLDAQTGGYQIKASSTQVDDLDLHQAYINLHDILDSGLDIKAGRQEAKFGKGRLISNPSWSNRLRHFDGGIVHYQHNAFSGDFLYLQDVKYDDGQANQSRSEEFVAGFYGGYQKDKQSPLIEPYFLTLIDIKGANDIERHTVGAHLQATIAGGAVLDIEFPYQFGHTGSAASKKDIRAYAYHIDITKNFESAKWKPKLSLSYDEASGDADPDDTESNTFIPLYQSTHDNYGIIDLFRWQNLRNPEISMTFSPSKRFKFTPQMDFFWLQSKFDNWYNSSGGNTRTKTGGDRGYYVGSELSLRAYYEFNKNIKVESGYAHFFTGGYVKDSGADDDTDWFYSQISLKY